MLDPNFICVTWVTIFSPTNIINYVGTFDLLDLSTISNVYFASGVPLKTLAVYKSVKLSKIFRSYRSHYFDSLTLWNIYPKFKFDTKNVSVTNANHIVIFGLIFHLMRADLFIVWFEKDYDVLELIFITEELFRYLNSINERGFIKEESLNDSFMVDNMNLFCSLGFEKKLLGNTEITYAAWYNFPFLISTS